MKFPFVSRALLEQSQAREASAAVRLLEVSDRAASLASALASIARMSKHSLGPTHNWHQGNPGTPVGDLASIILRIARDMNCYSDGFTEPKR